MKYVWALLLLVFATGVGVGLQHLVEREGEDGTNPLTVLEDKTF